MKLAWDRAAVILSRNALLKSMSQDSRTRPSKLPRLSVGDDVGQCEGAADPMKYSEASCGVAMAGAVRSHKDIAIRMVFFAI